MDTDVRPTLAAAYTHGPGKTVPLDASAPPDERTGRGPGVALAALAASGPFAAAVVRALRLALAPRRWEPWNRYNDHRAYPSPRAAFVVAVAILVGPNRWTVDPVRDRVFGPSDSPAAVALSDAVRLELTPMPGLLAASYGSLADALAHLEAGHVAAALVEAAAACGLAAHCSTADGPAAGPAVSIAISFTECSGQTWPIGRVIAGRSSGVAPRGLAVDPRPLPAATLPELARAGSEAPAGSPAHWSGLRHVAAVRGITGFADGIYAVSGAAPLLSSSGNVMTAVQAAFTYPPSSIETAGMNVAWVMTAAVAHAVRAGGPTEYYRLLVAAGATAQHVGTAAAASDLFCRPCRSVREARLEAVVAAPADHDFLYLLLIGRSRLRDFPYELTRPEELP